MARSGCWTIDPEAQQTRALQMWSGLSAEERSARNLASAATNLARHGVAGIAAQHRRAADTNHARHGEDGVAAQRSRAADTNHARHGEDGVAAQRSRAAATFLARGADAVLASRRGRRGVQQATQPTLSHHTRRGARSVGKCTRLHAPTNAHMAARDALMANLRTRRRRGVRQMRGLGAFQSYPVS
jgi:hypothetical protein